MNCSSYAYASSLLKRLSLLVQNGRRQASRRSPLERAKTTPSSEEQALSRYCIIDQSKCNEK